MGDDIGLGSVCFDFCRSAAQYIYRVSHQYGNTFNFNFSFCIRATAKVKPVLKNSDPNLQGVPGYMNPRKQNLWKF